MAAATSYSADVGASALRAIQFRIIGLLFLLFVLNAIDRANVSFAALQMNRDLGLDPKAYGFGAGMTFIGLLLFQIPSMSLLRRMSARVWLASLVVGWGAVSASMAWISNGREFAILRFLLGVFEAGFSPGMLYIITRWIPQDRRGSATGLLIMAVPLSLLFGGPLCGWLLEHGALVGQAGWRFLYLVNGLVTVVAGVLTYFVFSDEPALASWLSAEQREWLSRRLAADSASDPGDGAPLGLGHAIRDPAVWGAAFVWCMLTSGMFGLVFWLPQIVKAYSAGRSDLAVASIASLPWIAAALGTLLNGRLSDRTGRRRLHVGVAGSLGALGLLVGWVSPDPVLSVAGLVLAGLGMGGAHGVFWTIPMSILRPRMMASGILLINISSTIAGFLITNLIGIVRGMTGSFVAAGFILSGMVLLGVLVMLALPRRTSDRLATLGSYH